MGVASRSIKKIAVIGTGVSGLVAARMLCRDYELTIFEAAPYAGGHANTVDVDLEGKTYTVDTGFMVFNRATYPNFCRLLWELGIPAQNAEMSFSVHCERSGLEYQGSSLRGLFAQWRNAFRPSFYRMLNDIRRFNREAETLLESDDCELVLRDFLDQGGYGTEFRNQYLVPMIAAIWSANPNSVLDFPAVFVIRFFKNHGLIQIRNRPAWKTIPGGSRRYVEAMIAPFKQRIRFETPVESVYRHADYVAVQSTAGIELFDSVIMATHANQSLGLLTDADPVEREVLSAFPYQRNEAVLHTDQAMLPDRRRAWASWNYRVSKDPSQAASVTYDLSRLQAVPSPRPILVTLNPTQPVDPAQVLRRFVYHHPVFTRQSIAAQERFEVIQGPRRTYFCGAYRFHGFHEDGVRSGLEVGSFFGKGIEHCKVVSTKGPSSTVELVQ